MKDATLGSLINETAQRDAIHIAIAPVVAAHAMKPGQHVGLLDNGTVSAKAKKLIGIVDPFLKEVVVTGEQFYLCLYPRTITSLRHDWTHPDFIALPKPSPEKELAEMQLRKFAESAGADYEWVLERLAQAIDGNAYGGDDSTADQFNAHKAELFVWYAALTGKAPSDVEGIYFSCAC